MGYWQDSAKKEGPQTSPKVPAGQADLHVSKIIFGTKNGGFFTTKDNDRQILVVFKDNQERECAQMYTLSDNAGWALAKLLEACGLNLTKMDEAGVKPDRFTDERFATANLVGRKIRADVSYETVNGKEYARVVPMKRAGSAATATAPAQENFAEDAIPI